MSKVYFKVDSRQHEMELSMKALFSENKELKEEIFALKQSVLKFRIGSNRGTTLKVGSLNIFPFCHFQVKYGQM